MFNLSEIKELIKMIDKSSIEEFEIENENTRLYISKPKAPQTVAHTAAPVPVPYYPVNQPQEAVQAPVKQDSVQQAAAPAEAPAKADRTGLHEITSPMVGTFYAAPSPDSEPYVQVGDKVSENTVVCIVEAMKLMNEIVAEVKGEIVEVLVDNAQLVEYGQPLFLVKTD